MPTPRNANTTAAPMFGSSPGMGGASNELAKARMGPVDHESETSTLDAVDKMDGSRGRLTGSAASLFRVHFGEPVWAQPKDIPGCDTLKVVRHEHMDSDQQPDWYQSDDRNLGEIDGALGGLRQFEVGMPAGTYYCCALGDGRSYGDYFQVEYQPMTLAPATTATTELQPDGLLGPGLRGFSQAYFTVFMAINPIDNFASLGSGREVDPFSQSFGNELTAEEMRAEALQAISEIASLVTAFGSKEALTTAEWIGLGITAGSAVGEDILDKLVQAGMDEADAQYARAVIKLVNLCYDIKTFNIDAYSAADLLGVLSSAVDLDVEGSKALLGEEGYNKLYGENGQLMSDVFGGSSDIGAIIDVLRASD